MPTRHFIDFNRIDLGIQTRRTAPQLSKRAQALAARAEALGGHVERDGSSGWIVWVPGVETRCANLTEVRWAIEEAEEAAS